MVKKNRIKTDDNGLPILNQFSETDLVNCVFRIKNKEKIDDALAFHMEASYKGEAVGIDVNIFRGIEAGYDENMKPIPEHVYRPGVIFSRSGPESDRLILAIAELYGKKVPDKHMIDQESYTTIILECGAIHLETDAINMKLFGKDSEENSKDYYESLFNVDIRDGLVFWNEADPKYRDALLRAMATK